MATPLMRSLVFLAVALIAPSIVRGETTGHTVRDEGFVSDQEIIAAIEYELRGDEAVSAHHVNVDSLDGVVTLSGSVAKMLARDRAGEQAATIKGVRAVVNHIEVRSVERSDAAIRKDVEEALFADPATDAYEIDVEVDNAVVTLEGVVHSGVEKMLCEEVAKGIKGIRKVENRITLAYKGERSDETLEAEIERRFASDVWLNAERLDVSVEDGTVTLSGAVPTVDEKSRAYAGAWVPGVEDVDNDDLSVSWFAENPLERKKQRVNKSDAEIRRAVDDALRYDPRVKSFDITVEVEEGVVALSGEVDHLQAKRSAEKDARNTLGVAEVRNRIKVRPGDHWSAAEIEEAARSALKRDPYVERHELQIYVRNGKVHLYGMVDSMFEKLRASEIASRVKGVVEVHNGLIVHEVLTWF